ncbi:MAG TPA: metallophosphoesterase family protein [Brevibacillus sp.]|nr:metallophosphoesterase family protein [Brevibacillus sp.]
MKIAALYDIHGNLPALNAVLSELDQVRPDLIIVGGDIVAGPMPVQTLERLFQLKYPIQFIRGNNDREVVMTYDGKPLRSDMSEKGREKARMGGKTIKSVSSRFSRSFT